MPSYADQYLDDVSDAEDVRLWGERVSIGSVLVTARWSGYRSRNLTTGELNSSLTERIWYIAQSDIPSEPAVGTRIIALDESEWEVLDEQDGPAVTVEGNDWRVHAVRVIAT